MNNPVAMRFTDVLLESGRYTPYHEGWIVVIAVFLFRSGLVLAEGSVFIVRVPLSSSPSRGRALVFLLVFRGVQGDRPLARAKTALGPFSSDGVRVLPHPKKPRDDNIKKYKDIY